MSHDPWVWVAAFLTLCIFSFLYKDNPFYRVAEYLLIGASLGYALPIIWDNTVIPKVIVPLQHHEYYLLIPLCLGLLYLARLFPKHAWLSRWPIAFALGTGSGIALPLSLQADIFKQIQGTMLTKAMLTPSIIPVIHVIGNIVLFVGVIATLIYFYFSVEHKRAVGGIARVGIWYIMLAFGATFGYTVMARISLLIGRFQFLLHDWLGLIK